MKKKILFIHSGKCSFVNADYRILREQYDVDLYFFKQFKHIFSAFLENLKVLFFLILKQGRKYDLFYFWFAGYHSFIPLIFSKIFRIKSVIIVGGYDVERYKDFNYGSFAKKSRAFVTKASLNMASLNISVSKYVQRRLKVITKSKSLLIYNCISLKNSNKLKGIEKDGKTVLTVANIDNIQNYYIKGIDIFIELAKRMKEYNFVAIGIKNQILKGVDLPNNLRVIKKIPQGQLFKYYEKASFYLQLSRRESFGIALAESVYFGCYPIVTKVGGMPEVIGTYGTQVKGDILEIVHVIKKHREKESFASDGGKNRIEQKFNEAERSKNLLFVINEIMEA
jgi:glycosyltransferase involved in cell wall biosynthesis